MLKEIVDIMTAILLVIIGWLLYPFILTYKIGKFLYTYRWHRIEFKWLEKDKCWECKYKHSFYDNGSLLGMTVIYEQTKFECFEVIAEQILQDFVYEIKKIIGIERNTF